MTGPVPINRRIRLTARAPVRADAPTDRPVLTCQTDESLAGHRPGSVEVR